MQYRIRSLKPGQQGARLVLGELEAEIMDFIWSARSATVRDVHSHLQKSRNIAYTTVMTIMTRLMDKALLAREKYGRGFKYTPALSKMEFDSLCVSAMTSCIEHLQPEVFVMLMERFLVSIKTKDIIVVDQLIKLAKDKKQSIKP